MPLFADPADIRALVLDDDEFALAFAEQALRSIGVSEVDCFDRVVDAEKALAHGTRHNLVLCDLQMPGVDGVQFMRWLAQRHRDLPVILMSAIGEEVLRAAEELAVEYHLPLIASIPKPLSAAALSDALAAASSHRRRGSLKNDASTMTPVEVLGAIQSEVELHYQPKISIADGSAYGFEALLRWRRQDFAPMSPYAFVCLAESMKLVDALTAKVFELAVRDLCRWQKQGALPRLSINISAANLRNLDLPDELAARLLACGLHNDLVTLELTETAIVEDMARTLDILTRLRIRGFELSLDDFGTGHASLEKLSQMPFTELKIDRSFVAGSRRSPNTFKILKASVNLAHELGLRVVAEGIEDDHDLATVRDLGCEYAQGYLFAKALPPERVVDFLLQRDTPDGDVSDQALRR